MFANRIRRFRVAGIQISADLSWFLLLALVTWSLATTVSTEEASLPGYRQRPNVC